MVVKGDKEGDAQASPRTRRPQRKPIEDKDPGETEDEGSPPPSKKKGRPFPGLFTVNRNNDHLLVIFAVITDLHRKSDPI